MIAVELGGELDQPVHRLEVALHHHRVGGDHRVAEPRDLQLYEAGGRIDLAACEHLRDDLAHAADRDLFHVGDVHHRGAHRQPLENALFALRRRPPRRAAPRLLRRRLFGGGGFLRGLRHGWGSGSGGDQSGKNRAIGPHLTDREGHYASVPKTITTSKGSLQPMERADEMVLFSECAIVAALGGGIALFSGVHSPSYGLHNLAVVSKDGISTLESKFKMLGVAKNVEIIDSTPHENCSCHADCTAAARASYFDGFPEDVRHARPCGDFLRLNFREKEGERRPMTDLQFRLYLMSNAMRGGLAGVEYINFGLKIITPVRRSDLTAVRTQRYARNSRLEVLSANTTEAVVALAASLAALAALLATLAV
ncbi:MAG: hypothetical protein ABR929_10785 [Roseiarcus sp.]